MYNPQLETFLRAADAGSFNKAAEELYITPGTAHAHIKRIYAKTGLHSRQEILDYMQQYTS